ncbi:hypothetical protein A2164_03840 [Candidatus Curtissbacteria bacterium RBG_13_35_7]|uniref:Methyltransferase type 11 domain-containing protein n=1 Tax=Candidatus Curtissbacteria bacterium RBG_13_35_7 TaxID=1797705 RepID=A0A1F5G5B1_9BACT|nr:MAG: hypothetical protein A2164_03840 [Candidatus Curtissbacteria bacterium RBG_13_35_7]
MKKSDYLLRYIKLAPLQIALVRAEEAYFMAETKMYKPILDIGCSDGIFGEVLFNNRKGAINFGVDIDKVALKFCQKRRVYRKVLFTDARKLPFPSDFFKTVMSNQSLEHIKEIESVLKEVSRVIKRGGKFIFLVPTIYLDDYWLTSAVFNKIGLNSIAKNMHNIRNKFFRHHNLWPLRRWKNLLENNGFELKSYRYVGTKRVYFISELLWPARIPSLIISRIFHKNILFPRKFSIFFANKLTKVLNNEEDIVPVKGPTMLIIAQK